MKSLYFSLIVAVLFPLSSWAAGGGGHGASGKTKPWNNDYVAQPPVNPALATNPASPTLTSPEPLQKIAGTNVTLTWQAVEGADAYHVQVATDPNFKWLVMNEPMFPQTTTQPQGLVVNQNYYWRVAAWKNGQNWGANKSHFSASSFSTR
jgi:hypothetical protein